MWFPKPAGLEDIRIEGAAEPADVQEWLFGLFRAEHAVEWREKVGVVSPADGSAKRSTRLLCSGGWVLKTNVDSARASEGEVRDGVRAATELARRARLWHPQKIWAVYHAEGLYYPLSATPELATLRRIGTTGEKLRAWTEMLELAVAVAVRNEIGLDLNPANFGREGRAHSIHYLDDEWYPTPRFRDLAAAMVRRLPEEPDIGESEWRSWGKVVAAVLEPLCARDDAWDELLDEVRAYPLADAFGARRAALREGLASTRTRRRRRGRRGARARPSSFGRTAVLGDVHGNLPALEAVLEECRSLGVDSYLFLGDAVGYGPFPRECVGRLAELPDATYVRGNHDHALGTRNPADGMNRLARSCAQWTDAQLSAEDREWLLGLPLEQAGAGWMAVHGAPRDPRRFLAYVYELTFEDNLEHLAGRDLNLCFCGHTHVQHVYERLPSGRNLKIGAPLQSSLEARSDRIMLVNPGSVGQPRDGDRRAAFAVWDRPGNSVSLHRVAYPVDEVVDALRSAGLPSGLGERLLAAA